jgi:gamma-glutamylcyclotransferase (GGCT)/AIG2-like uncharacterized protein YtfP
VTRYRYIQKNITPIGRRVSGFPYCGAKSTEASRATAYAGSLIDRRQEDIMTTPVESPVLLFSYGTLQDKAVQLANFGRELEGRPDSMLGYVQTWVEIVDPQVLATSGKTHHPIIKPGEDLAQEIGGTVFEITPAELEAADRYEVSDYKRVYVALKSGAQAWVYVSA